MEHPLVAQAAGVVRRCASRWGRWSIRTRCSWSIGRLASRPEEGIDVDRTHDTCMRFAARPRGSRSTSPPTPQRALGRADRGAGRAPRRGARRSRRCAPSCSRATARLLRRRRPEGRRRAVTPGCGAGAIPSSTILRRIWDGPKPVDRRPSTAMPSAAASASSPRPTSRSRPTRPTFSFSEVRVGVIPAMISVVVLPKLGVHNTMRLFLTGETLRRARRRWATACCIAWSRPPSWTQRSRKRSTRSRSAARTPSREAKQLVRTCPASLDGRRPSPTRRRRSPSCSRRPRPPRAWRRFAQRRKPAWASRHAKVDRSQRARVRRERACPTCSASPTAAASTATA